MRNVQQIKEELERRDQGLMGLVSCFMGIQRTLSVEEIDKFLDTVPEEGEALWLKFTAWRDGDESPEDASFIGFVKAMNAAA